MDITYPCTKADIEQVLPHRDPFLWLTRVTQCNPGQSVVAELDVDPNLPLFAGHFPAKPVLPGVIIMEALAQAACFTLMVGSADAGRVGYLVGVDKAKFRNQVSPGDTLRLEVEIVRNSPRMCVAEVAAFVGDTPIAQATQKYVLG